MRSETSAAWEIGETTERVTQAAIAMFISSTATAAMNMIRSTKFSVSCTGEKS